MLGVIVAVYDTSMPNAPDPDPTPLVPQDTKTLPSLDELRATVDAVEARASKRLAELRSQRDLINAQIRIALADHEEALRAQRALAPKVKT